MGIINEVVLLRMNPYPKLPDDIKELAPIVLSHRVMLNRTHGMRTQSFEQAERMVIDIVETVPVPV